MSTINFNFTPEETSALWTLITGWLERYGDLIFEGYTPDEGDTSFAKTVETLAKRLAPANIFASHSTSKFLCDDTGCPDPECACWDNFCGSCGFETDGDDCPKCV